MSPSFRGKIKTDEEAKAQAMAQFIGVVVPAQDFSKYFDVIGVEESPNEPSPNEKIIDNPAIVFARWQKYEHGMVGYTQAYNGTANDLARLSASPLLPKMLRAYIAEFQAIGRHNLLLIGDVVTECAKEMPEHFPTASDMKRFSADWVWNRFNKRKKVFEPSATKILDYLNTYLKVEQIME